ncbi:MAG: helix-turn-helix domain-containing protein [Pseudobdellovibrionaceae bacterium]
MTEKSASLKRTLNSPIWEGVIFPGLERDDPRATVYASNILPPLQPFIEAIWFMTWDIPDGTELFGIGAPIPCIKLKASNFNDLANPVYSLIGTKDKGIMLKFKGSGQAVGIDFKPGGLFPFIGKSVNSLRGTISNANDILHDLPVLTSEMWDFVFADLWSQNIQKYLQQKLTDLRPHHLFEISQLIEKLLSDKNINQVDELLLKGNYAKRSMQRIFQDEVGLSIKDVIRIARFNRAIKTLNGTSIESFAQFALESGYFDQPHMVNDFKKLVSESPKIFRKYW